MSASTSRQSPFRVSFWGAGHENGEYSSVKDADKVKFCETHPYHPWIISADRCDMVSIWDYNHRERIMYKSANEIFNLSDSSNTMSSATPTKVSEYSQNRPFVKESFVQKRLHNRHASTLAFRETSCKPNEGI